MKILGIDFTSAPNRRKPITCAVADFANNVLAIESAHRLPTFTAFEQTLAQLGPWIAGLTCPLANHVASSKTSVGLPIGQT